MCGRAAFGTDKREEEEQEVAYVPAEEKRVFFFSQADSCAGETLHSYHGSDALAVLWKRATCW